MVDFLIMHGEENADNFKNNKRLVLLGVSGRVFVLSLATLEPINSIATSLSGQYSKLKF